LPLSVLVGSSLSAPCTGVLTARANHGICHSQAICTIAGLAAGAMGIPPERISFPHALQAAAATVAAFPLNS